LKENEKAVKRGKGGAKGENNRGEAGRLKKNEVQNGQGDRGKITRSGDRHQVRQMKHENKQQRKEGEGKINRCGIPSPGGGGQKMNWPGEKGRKSGGVRRRKLDKQCQENEEVTKQG